MIVAGWSIPCWAIGLGAGGALVIVIAIVTAAVELIHRGPS